VTILLSIFVQQYPGNLRSGIAAASSITTSSAWPSTWWSCGRMYCMVCRWLRWMLTLTIALLKSAWVDLMIV